MREQHRPSQTDFVPIRVAAENTRLQQAEMPQTAVLPPEVRTAFEQTGYGCLAASTHRGVVHFCHAADHHIAGFIDKPIWHHWQLAPIPTVSTPLAYLEILILDDPLQPYTIESRLNLTNPQQVDVLAQLADQAQLHLAFYGDDLHHHFTRSIVHTEASGRHLAALLAGAPGENQ